MKRAVIIAQGEVQRVGYRDTVERIARKLKLTGFVENLKPYDVKIVAEGEQDILDKFITQIRMENHPGSPISVEDLDARFETATGEFEYFEIKRGDWRDELGERLDTAGALLHQSVSLGVESVAIGREMLGKQDQMLDKQDQMIGKQDQMLDKQDQMIGKQDQMLDKQDEHTHILTEFRDQTQQNSETQTHIMTELRDQTQQNFKVLDVKYGRISDNMDRLIEEMRTEREESHKSMERLTDVLIELVRSRERK